MKLLSSKMKFSYFPVCYHLYYVTVPSDLQKNKTYKNLVHKEMTDLGA